MSDLTFENAMYSWVIFWVVYWISGIYLSWKNRIERPLVNLSKVLNRLLLNMMWTFLGTLTVFYIPLRLVNNLNIINKLILCNIITEIWFYHVHLMMHHGALYNSYHKLHHSLTNRPYALSAMYCTGYEAIFCNVFSVGLGPVMLNITAPYLYVWFGLVAINSTFTHSGLRLGWLMDGSHDLHHDGGFTSNYGTLTLFDRIYGTYKDPSEHKPDKEQNKEKKEDNNEQKKQVMKEQVYEMNNMIMTHSTEINVGLDKNTE